MSKSLIVIGGGAAGFFGAINAARLNPDLSVTILEKSREVLSKVRISGGGRCNVTHHCYDNEVLARAYPRGGKALRWAFEQFDARDTVNWFTDRGVELKTEEDGRMFPVTDDSATVINCLKEEAQKFGVTIRTKTKAETISPQADGSYEVALQKARTLTAETVLIATGGYNRRNAYNWLEKLGHSIQEPVPSLFTFNFREKIFSELAGISVPKASVTIKGSEFEYTGPLLITHWGLSGPSVLKTSSWAARYLHGKEYRFDIQVNWVHPATENEVQSALKKLRNDNARKLVKNQDWFSGIPLRLWEKLLQETTISPEKRWAELSNQDIHKLTQQLTSGTYTIQGKTTYKDEFVTSGGIPLEEVNFGTMESKKCPGLYFAGEVLNIDGITGGYNFQSAWTTGWIAANAIGQR
jgi:predicted Rossmann fold flavoprotein